MNDNVDDLAPLGVLTIYLFISSSIVEMRIVRDCWYTRYLLIMKLNTWRLSYLVDTRIFILRKCIPIFLNKSMRKFTSSPITYNLCNLAYIVWPFCSRYCSTSTSTGMTYSCHSLTCKMVQIFISVTRSPFPYKFAAFPLQEFLFARTFLSWSQITHIFDKTAAGIRCCTFWVICIPNRKFEK